MDLHNPHVTAFGAMDEVYGHGTAQALRDSGGPWEHWTGSKWTYRQEPVWLGENAYRLKPQPPKPREITLFEYEDGTASNIMLSMRGMFTAKTKWREVIE
jgi:hypothetical protein